ncbi:unnamed protein product, partial [Brassica rapa]
FFLFWFLSYSILIPIKYIKVKNKRKCKSPSPNFLASHWNKTKLKEGKKSITSSSSSVTLSFFFLVLPNFPLIL